MRINLDVTVGLPPIELFDDKYYNVDLSAAIFNPKSVSGWETFVIDGLRVYITETGLQLDSYSKSKISDLLPSWMDYGARYYTRQMVINYVVYAINCDQSYKEAMKNDGKS